jgi:hypothetical protein
VTAGKAPLWLLDVDGVLNAVTRRPDPSVWPDWAHGYATAEGRRWPITFSPTVMRTIARLHETGAAEARWLTTWEDAANGELAALLELPALEVAGRRASTGVRGWQRFGGAASVSTHAEAAGAAARDELTGRWWKFDAVRALVADDPERPLVWTDDDLVLFDGAQAWLREHADVLLLAPAPETGLTAPDLRAVEEFVARH